MERTLRDIQTTEERLHTETRVVRFQEVDAAGIVFYARIFDYFHDAYVGLLRARGAPLERALRDGSWVAPLTRAEAEYVRPLRFGDEIEVAVVAVEVDETEYAVGYRIDIGGELACVGRTRHVAVDPATFRRAPVPEVLRRALIEHRSSNIDHRSSIIDHRSSRMNSSRLRWLIRAAYAALTGRRLEAPATADPNAEPERRTTPAAAHPPLAVPSRAGPPSRWR